MNIQRLAGIVCVTLLLAVSFEVAQAFSFSKLLAPGDSDADVLLLQKALNALGLTVAPGGSGSPGNETTYYGDLTANAVQSFQCEHGIVCEGAPETTGYGQVGPRTLSLLNSFVGTISNLFSGASSQLAQVSGGDYTTGLEGHWKFEDGSGTTAVNSANTDDATLTGNPSWASGNTGSGALQFDGVDDYINLKYGGGLHDLSNSTFSATTWVKLSSTGATKYVFDKKGNNNRGWFLRINSSGSITFTCFGVSKCSATTPGTPIQDDIWHHIALVRNGSNYRIYVDGSEELNTTLSVNPQNGTGPLTMGGQIPTSGFVPTTFADYTVDDVRIYSRALSAADALALYTDTNDGGVIATKYTLTVEEVGSGSGIISGNGISCGTDCTHMVAHGSSVTLTATANTGSTFVGWSGGGCSGAGDCAVSLTSDTSISATFVADVAPPAPGEGTTITHTSGGVEFTWELHCGGRPCQHGQFVNGEYWVVPIDDRGRRVSAVTVTNILPDDAINGAEINPSSTDTQGILPMYSTYDPVYNIMTQLPYPAQPGQSIFKAANQTSGCGTSAVSAGCVYSDDVLTILDDVPPNNGATVFRPPFHGNWKPLYTTDNVEFDRLPSIAAITTKLGTFGVDSLTAIRDRWVVPQYDTTHGSGFTGEFMRGTTPHAVLDSYAGTQADRYVQDMLTVFATQSINEKKPAVYSLMQKGIDIYGIFKLDIPFSSGAGQHLGKKPALAFFAAMYDDTAITNEVRAVATDPNYVDRSFFQEDSQLYRGPSGMVVWTGGGTPARTSGSVNSYWNGYFAEWAARNLGGGGADRNGANGDPTGYIDGPGGGPEPTNSRGRNYQHCCSGGPFIGFAFAQHLMPWLMYANGDNEILEYADRFYKGRNIPGFEGGFWSGYDVCAPVDPRESLSCQPYRDGKDCLYYKVTWGPEPDNPTQCIPHGGDPLTDGRWPQFNGSGADGKIGRLPTLLGFTNLWSVLRDCADSSNPGYHQGECSGMGEAVPGFTPYNPTFDYVATGGTGTGPSPAPPPPPPPTNNAPTVSAGSNKVIQLPTNSVLLVGSATDDGLPNGSTPTVAWSKVAGQGTVTFANSSLVTTNATFSGVGTYVLRLTVNDSDLSGSDEVEVTVRADETPPVRSAGLPNTTLPHTATQATLSVTTNESASCRWSTSAGTSFSSMPDNFNTTNGRTHTDKLSSVTAGESYTFYVRCRDDEGNVNTDDYTIAFSLTPEPEIPDADGDGIPDESDTCPVTKNNIRTTVNQQGCPRPLAATFDIKPNFQTIDLRDSTRTLFEIGKGAYAKLSFANKRFRLMREELDGSFSRLDFDSAITMEKHKITLDTTLLPEFDQPATITFFDVTVANPIVKRDGAECSSCTIESFSNGTLVVSVPGFSTYEVEEEAAPEVVEGESASSEGSGGGEGGSSKSYVRISGTGMSTPMNNTSTLSVGNVDLSNFRLLFTRNISRGSEGEDVRELQKLLNRLGFTITTSGGGSPGNETRYFGGLTESALRRFQCQFNIVCSGSVATTGYGNAGLRTRVYLSVFGLSNISGISGIATAQSTASQNTASGFTRNLALHMRGEDVRQLQILLNKHGFIVSQTAGGSPGKETTYFGTKTLEAVIRFQNAYASEILSSNNLTQGTGFVGPSTRKKLTELQ